jgi:Spy/CpxP family protein refolding chaperone
MENIKPGKEKVMNTNNQKRDASPDANHLIKEDIMNKTRKIRKGREMYAFFATLAVVVLIAAFGLMAQPMLAEAKGRFGPPKSADEIMQTLTERLDLTPEQAEAVRPLIEDKINVHKEIREKKDTDRKARRAEMRKLRWNTEIRLSEILTDEQVDKYLELKQEQRKEFKRGRHGGGWMKKGMHKDPEQVIERLRTRLDLTEEQAVQAGPIIKESIDKRRAVFEKYREQGLKVKQAMRSEMQVIGDVTHAELATILSDEQIEELNAMKEEKRARIEKWTDRSGQGEY